MTSTTVRKEAAKSAALTSEREPIKLQRWIGSTLYEVSVYTNPIAIETMEQKLLRLIENEVLKNA
jgi:hypothetical protein